MFEILSFLKKTCQQSNHIISNSTKVNVLETYNKLTENKQSRNLYGNQVQSLEIVHLVDYLPNNYAVTDKADGERYQGIIHDSKLFLIDINLKVIETDFS